MCYLRFLRTKLLVISYFAIISANAEVPTFKEKNNEGLNKLERIESLEKQLVTVSSGLNALEKKFHALDEKFQNLEKEFLEIKKDKIK